MKLSIIVPVYNLEQYISAALDSLLSIRFSYDYEILLINDGSTDRSEEIIRQYAAAHRNIRLFSIHNQGVSNARNIGLREASGEYIAFVDGDDTVDPDFYENAVRELDEGSYTFVQGNYQVVSSDICRFEQYVETDCVITDRNEMFKLFFGPDKKIHNSICSKVFQAGAVRKLQLDSSLCVSEDQKFVFDVLMGADSIKLLSALCYHYYQRSGSAIHSMSTAKQKDKLAALAYFKDRISGKELRARIERQEFMVLLNMYVTAARHREDSSEFYASIMKLNIRSFFPYLDFKTKLHTVLLCTVPNVYNFYLSLGRLGHDF